MREGGKERVRERANRERTEREREREGEKLAFKTPSLKGENISF